MELYNLTFKPGTPAGRRVPGFLKLFLCRCLYACLCSPPRLLHDLAGYGLHMIGYARVTAFIWQL